MTDSLTVRRSLGAVFALVLALVSLAVTPLYAAGSEKTPDGRLLITKGHVDAFNVSGNASGVTLDLKEDVTGSQVRHKPENVILGVVDGAWTEQTKNVPSLGSAGYYLPMTQNPSIVWPGWDSLGAQPLQKVTYKLASITGPGDVFMWTSGPFGGGVEPRQENGSLKVTNGSTWVQDYAAHEHISWLFTKPGTYTMTLSATVDFEGTSKTTNSATYTWAIGGNEIESFRAEPVTQVTPKPVTFDNDKLAFTVPTTDGIIYSMGGTAIAAGTHSATDGQQVTITASAKDGYAITSGATTSWSHTFTAPVEDDDEDPVEKDPETTEVTPAAPTFDDKKLTMTIPTSTGTAYFLAERSVRTYAATSRAGVELAPGVYDMADGQSVTISASPTEGYTFPESAATSWSHTFKAEAPVEDAPGEDSPDVETPAAPGEDTPGQDGSAPVEQNPAPDAGASPTPAPAKPAPTKPAPVAPGQSAPSVPTCIPTAVTTPGGTTTKVGGSYTVPSNTHAHPNWVFTKPGTYKATITQSATIEGKKLSTSGVITFIVGGAGNANDGHFDIGTAYEGGKLTMLIKDDRQVPATWVAPSSLTFGLSDKAKATAPAGMEFIAPAGSEVWMISASQVSGVPWVGANTMHPSLKGTTEVTWTLSNVSGPGAMAVFSSGNLSPIGQT